MKTRLKKKSLLSANDSCSGLVESSNHFFFFLEKKKAVDILRMFPQPKQVVKLSGNYRPAWLELVAPRKQMEDYHHQISAKIRNNK